MLKQYYLAYGSNLHPVRLGLRCHSVKTIGVATLVKFELTFHKRSKDLSGKCNLLEKRGATAYGALFEIDSSEVPNLDKYEGVGTGYYKTQLSVTIGDQEYKAFTYLAETKYIDTALRPYAWYKALVVAGGRYHRMPETYIQSIEAIESAADLDVGRRSENELLLAKLLAV
jgi:gamma-glutamylcyclotransferase